MLRPVELSEFPPDTVAPTHGIHGLFQTLVPLTTGVRDTADYHSPHATAIIAVAVSWERFLKGVATEWQVSHAAAKFWQLGVEPLTYRSWADQGRGSALRPVPTAAAFTDGRSP